MPTRQSSNEICNPNMLQQIRAEMEKLGIPYKPLYETAEDFDRDFYDENAAPLVF